VTETLVCANHPDRTTLLRCNRCEKPICTKCAILTPVGYRCRECVQGVRKGFDNIRPTDLPLAALLAAGGTGLGVFLLQNLGFWGLIVAPVAGGALAEGVRWAVRRRRSTRLPLVAAAGGAAGVVAAMALPWIALLPWVGAESGLGVQSLAATFLSAAIWHVLPGALMISTMYYRLRGIQL
jgi:hypothetical protein